MNRYARNGGHMQGPEGDSDAAAALLERRWFASMRAVRAMQGECEVLREVMQLAENAWRRARNELIRLELLRDALGEELAEYEIVRERRAETRGPQRRISSAA